MAVTKKFFGRTADGREVTAYTLTGSEGASVTILDLGGTIQALKVPAADGTLTDVVLGYDDVAGYEQNDGYFGALIGRYGNRIANARFTLNGAEYQLFANDNHNHLHGGKEGFDKKIWAAEIEGDSLVLSCVSPDMEEGYPGTLTVTVIYSFNEKNELTIDYRAVSDKDTILNLTNHAYFNLSGEGSGTTVEDQELMIAAEAYTAVDKFGLTVEEVIPVEGTPFDFRTLKPIGRDIDMDDVQLRNGGGYDHNFVLGEGGELRRVITAHSPRTGIYMGVCTTQPGVQLYTGNMTGDRLGKSGHAYGKRTGFCLETQHYPNSMACPSFPSVVLKAGEAYEEVTVYGFSCEK